MTEIQNRIVGLVGRKGSGKSTRLRDLLRYCPRFLVFDVMGEHTEPKDNRFLVWIDLPRLPKVDDLGATIVNLGTVKNPSYDTLDHVFPVQEWKKFYTSKKWRGHVFAPLQYRAQVNKVAIDVLQDRIKGLRFSTAATSICKL